jgi:hypothetical protein
MWNAESEKLIKIIIMIVLIGAMKNEKERMSTTQTIYERLDLNQI